MLEESSVAKEEQRRAKEREEQRIAREVTEDFERRRSARRSVENGWLLNMNFYNGNQYCDVSPFGGIEEEDSQFYWQSRRVFNHIAPTVDSRIAKLEKRKPELKVRAFSDEDGDVQAAKLATGVLKYVQERIGLGEIVSKGIVWSETCGSAFYKILWAEDGGRQVAVDMENKPVFEGEVQVRAVSPFEIFPDRLDAENIEELGSLIHAQAVTAEYIYERFGVAVPTGQITGLSLRGEPSAGKLLSDGVSLAKESIKEGVILLERYTKPNRENPDGKLEIVAGDKLLYSGGLPYINGDRGQRIFPFVKQDSLRLPGAFFCRQRH